MGNDEFTNLVKAKVAQYVNDNFSKELRNGKILGEDDIYLPWVTKVLQNNKATASTYLDDGVYFEATYNGGRQELYLDVYDDGKHTLDVRQWVCPKCKTHHDRDINAAKNILVSD